MAQPTYRNDHVRSADGWTDVDPDGIIALAQSETDKCYRQTREVFLDSCQHTFSEAVSNKSLRRSEVVAVLLSLSSRMLEKSDVYIKAFATGIESVYRHSVQDRVEPEIAYKWRCVVFFWYKAAIVHDIERAWLKWVESVLKSRRVIGFARSAISVDDPEYKALQAHENEMPALRARVFGEVWPIRDDLRTWIIERYSQDTFGYKEPRSKPRSSKPPDPSYGEELLANLALTSDRHALERLKPQFELLAESENGLPDNQRLRAASRGAEWELCGSRDEKLRVDFEESAVRAGIALNAPPEIGPFEHWLTHLRLYLLCTDSEMLFPRRDREAMITRPLVSSAMFCSSIAKFALAHAQKSRSNRSGYDALNLESAGPTLIQQTRPEQGRTQDDTCQPHKCLVEDFLRRCRAAGIRVRKSHIATAAGHKSPRQLQYWQKEQQKIEQGPGYTPADDKNFRRVLAMTPQAFWKVVQSKSKVL